MREKCLWGHYRRAMEDDVEDRSLDREEENAAASSRRGRRPLDGARDGVEPRRAVRRVDDARDRARDGHGQVQRRAVDGRVLVGARGAHGGEGRVRRARVVAVEGDGELRGENHTLVSVPARVTAATHLVARLPLGRDADLAVAPRRLRNDALRLLQPHREAERIVLDGQVRIGRVDCRDEAESVAAARASATRSEKGGETHGRG